MNDDEKGLFGEHLDIQKQYKTCAWFVTVCNYTEAQYDSICATEKIRYLVIGREICPTTGTPHIHFFIYYKNDVSFPQMKKRFPNAHLEVCRKFEACSKYCKKDGVFLELGKIPTQGARHDLELIKDQIINGRKVDDIVIQEPVIYHQYGRTLQKIEDVYMRSIFRSERTEGLWLYGTSGCGKSHLAFEGFNPSTHYVWRFDTDNMWNDGYSQQDTIIIDDFRGQMKYSDLLNMLDIHPNFFVKRRGRESLPFTSKKVIITSSLSPQEVYKNIALNDSLEQLTSRLVIKELIGENRRQLKNL